MTDQRAIKRSAPWKQWGSDLDPQSIDQMRLAVTLPVAVAGALMPDAHVGYGLPIGGVLATRQAVIPYAVGVDIACRMRMSILDLPVDMLEKSHERDRLKRAIERQTRFGIGAKWDKRQQHDVMDRNWDVSFITAKNKDKAWSQLGTSGSGNHFVEFGIFTLDHDDLGLAAGTYLALLSHSGSRGTGASVCDHYSKLAMKLRQHEIDPKARHLAWLNLDEPAGREYFEAMQLMGHYAAANHEVIHRNVIGQIGARAIGHIENHHNFAWIEQHPVGPGGSTEPVIVHRKGATPAAAGELGVIPGSMASPGFVVRGKGNEDSLRSASHGAGRVMSRRQAKQTFRWGTVRRELETRGIEVISAGADEVPGVYKDINAVMAAQHDLVEIVGRFDPRIVKMAPEGERAED